MQNTYDIFRCFSIYLANILRKKYIFWFDKNNEIQDPAIKEMIELLTAAA